MAVLDKNMIPIPYVEVEPKLSKRGFFPAESMVFLSVVQMTKDGSQPLIMFYYYCYNSYGLVAKAIFIDTFI